MTTFKSESQYTAIHKSVLLRESIDILHPISGGRYLDGTLGLGGHSFSIMERSGGRAELCGIDRDQQALELAKKRLARYGDSCHFFPMEFAEFDHALDRLNWSTVNGVLLDLGVSSLQLDNAERGFSFLHDAPLDMRMDMGKLDSAQRPAWKESAYSLVNTADKATLGEIIKKYGEDPLALRIADAIVKARENSPIETTGKLAEIVYHAYPEKWRKSARNHPATRTFQAIRIAINEELEQVETFLDKILPYLAEGGRLAVITFHSLEDRLVKQRFKVWSSGCICPPHLPKCVCGHKAEVKLLTPKAILPTEEELAGNPRSRSAKLRAVEKLPLI